MASPILPLPVTPGTVPADDAQFWERVDQSGGEDACWPWIGSRNNFGYGVWRRRRLQIGSHRKAWQLTNGPIPDGLFVLHRCDNPPCCNPAHLFLGTQADNVADCVSKGRQSSGERHSRLTPSGEKHFSKLTPERVVRGERHGRAKLSDDDVREIRRLQREGWSRYDLAARFGVNDRSISNVVLGRTWSHID